MYQYGQGVTQNYKSAVNWYKLASEQGHIEAQWHLASMYEKVENYTRAHMWFNIVLSQNSRAFGGSRRDDVEKKMTVEQVEKAQELARECVSKDYKDC